MRRLFLHILSVICLCSPIQLRAVENTLPTDSNFTNLLPERYPVSAETLPLFTTQIEITLPESTNSLENIVRLEYPEFAPLSSEETKKIRQANHQVPDSITLQADYGISRKKRHTGCFLLPCYPERRHLLSSHLMQAGGQSYYRQDRLIRHIQSRQPLGGKNPLWQPADGLRSG